MSLAELFQQTLLKLLPPGSRLVVGVSGGADSLTLLHLLHHLPATSQPDLHVATLDHGLRGEAGAADVQFVVETCRAWGIPVTTGQLDPASLPREAGVEGAARAARYDFLAQVAYQTGAKDVAVAHQADDQAETILMHLLRGSGLQGLAGMASAGPLPGHPDLTLIRPLLGITRAEINAYCEAHGLKPRYDHTNADSHLLRNRLRLETLPHLRQINPHVDQALNRLAAVAALDEAYIRQQLAREIAGQVTQSARRIALDRATYRSLHPALQQHFILWAAGQLGAQDGIAYEHVRRAADLAQRGTTSQQMPLPGGLRLRLDYAAVILEHQDAPSDDDLPLLPPETHLGVTIPGILPLPGGDWQLEAQPEPFDHRAGPHARLKIVPGQEVVLRTRRAGDRFAPHGLGGHTQKLKAWMIDHKIPRAIRAGLPILTVDGEIAAFLAGDRWVIGQRFAVQQAEEPVIYLRISRNPASERLS